MNQLTRIFRPEVELPTALMNSLSILLTASKRAQTEKVGPWRYAVNVVKFRAAGVADSDLRWLLWKGYVEHATEKKPHRFPHREFLNPKRPARNPTPFGHRSHA
jgi:hypothetical protein